MRWVRVSAIVVAGLAFNLTGELGAAALGGRHRRPAPPPQQLSAPAAAVAPTSAEPTDVVVARDLRVQVPSGDRWVEAVHGIDLDLRAGETLGLVGESGSGKSLTAMALAGLLPASARTSAATLLVVGQDLAGGTSRARSARSSPTTSP